MGNRRPCQTAFVLWGHQLFLGWSTAAAAGNVEHTEPDSGIAESRKTIQTPKHWITADHSQFEILDQEFSSGPEVTKACLSCHNEATQQVHDTIHWTWLCPADPNKVMGKNGLTMNNF